MRSISEILSACSESGCRFSMQALRIESAESGAPEETILARLASRLDDMELSVRESLANRWRGHIVPAEAQLLSSVEGTTLSGDFILRASRIAMAVATYNAAMGRIVAAPTAGSCGILPGVLFAFRDLRDATRETLLRGLVTAAAVGEVVAARATLAGASGGCQAECGAAAAMGAAALVEMRDGTPEAVAHAVALTFKSILGLVCDPVGGLVESPCIKRNALLVAPSILASDLALAGVRSLLPADEVIDAMGDVGRALPESLRETAKGGLAVTPTAKELVRHFSL
jgi:L-serine dehydratase